MPFKLIGWVLVVCLLGLTYHSTKLTSYELYHIKLHWKTPPTAARFYEKTAFLVRYFKIHGTVVYSPYKQYDDIYGLVSHEIDHSKFQKALEALSSENVSFEIERESDDMITPLRAYASRDLRKINKQLCEEVTIKSKQPLVNDIGSKIYFYAAQRGHVLDPIVMSYIEGQYAVTFLLFKDCAFKHEIINNIMEKAQQDKKVLFEFEE